MSTHPLEEILHPRSIAVVGASDSPDGRGYGFLAPLLEFGFKGEIYPVNPKYSEVLGKKAYPSVRDIPGPVDYVISAVPARLVPQMLEDCAAKGVKVAHLYTARFSETGRQHAAELEREVLRLAKKGGIRLIGPNCMGVYHPGHGLAFDDDAPKTSGTAGLISQSGNVAGDIVRVCGMRGVYFSKAISYGNAIDLNECDYLDYFAQDPETEVILMYIEGVKDGQRFFDVLRQATLVKPVIIIKGGRGKSGTRAAASHTASLAGSAELWPTMVAQAGAVYAESLEELIDLAASFYLLPPIKGHRVGVAGGAGGASVLAADQCELAGLDVVPLPTELREELKRGGISIWDWIGNPADMSIREDRDFEVGDMLQVMAKYQDFDFLIAIIGSPHHHHGQPEITTDTFLGQYRLNEVKKTKPLLAVVYDRSLGQDEWDSWNWRVTCEVRTKLIDLGVPFYPTITRAAIAARKLIEYYQGRRSPADNLR